MDTRTLLVATFAVSLVSCLSMSIVFWTRRTYAGFGYWFAGIGCRVIALMLFLLPRNLLLPWPAINVLADCLFLAEVMLIREGTLTFRNQTARYGWEIAGSLSFFALLVYFTYVAPSLNARTVVNSLFYAAWMAEVIRVLLVGRPPYFGSIDRWQVGILALLVAGDLGRGWYTWVHEPSLQVYLGHPIVMNGYILFMTSLSQLLTLSQIIMNAQRLEYDLRLSQEQLKQEMNELGQARDAINAANQALNTANGELHKLATTDPLTGAWNRRYFEEVAHREISRSHRYGEPLSLLLFDIDHFKKINDRCGHLTGDGVLVELAKRVRLHLRAEDGLGRWGGEEFVVMMPHCRASEGLKSAQKLCLLVAEQAFVEVGDVTVSVGVAELQRHETLNLWFKRADEAMYRAKDEGRNRVLLAEASPTAES